MENNNLANMEATPYIKNPDIMTFDELKDFIRNTSLFEAPIVEGITLVIYHHRNATINVRSFFQDNQDYMMRDHGIEVKDFENLYILNCFSDTDVSSIIERKKIDRIVRFIQDPADVEASVSESLSFACKSAHQQCVRSDMIPTLHKLSVSSM